MRLESKAFVNEGLIPVKYSCKGENINPDLHWSIDEPDRTESFCLVMDDPDAPAGLWVHWILYNIDKTTLSIVEGSLPNGSEQGLNSWNKNSYGGPCPPSGTHRYFFKLYSLDCKLPKKNYKKNDLEKVIKDHIISQAVLMGKFRK